MSALHHNRSQRGAILIESLIALAVLSLWAAAMFRAFDYMEAASSAASQWGTDVRARFEQTKKAPR